MSEESQELSLEEIRSATLNVLNTISAICEEYGLRYWLTYGSLIGAVRHGGFIPWDDDLDIAMPRPDYDEFLRIADQGCVLPSPMVALHYTYEKAMPFLITRVSDMRYRMIGEYGDAVPELGVFVDVYPIDGLGNDEHHALAKKQKAKVLRRAYYRTQEPLLSSRMSFAKRMARKVYSLVAKDQLEYLLRIERECTEFSFESSAFVACPLWEVTPAIYPKDDFAELIQMSFEDTISYVPAGYDDILKRIYGDYMQLPPEAERVPHHQYSIVRR